MTVQANFIVCENLVKIYKVENLEVVALQGLDLTVNRGEILGVIGPSGSGKSTLMNILGGLDRPSAGRALVGEQNLLTSSDSELDKYRRTQVGFMWQQTARNLVPYLNAIENVMLPMTLAGVSVKQKRDWADALLEMVGMSDRKHQFQSQLSGGEQQRVAIAVSLANRPGLLLADEPTGEVDEETAQQIYTTFKQLNNQLDLTILIVTHDPSIAKHVDRVISIQDGKLARETVRRTGHKRTENSDQQASKEAEEEFEEVSVLDSAGRVQLPKEYLDHLEIKKRVKLELIEDGILIRPITDSPHKLEKLPPAESDSLATTLTPQDNAKNPLEKIRRKIQGWRLNFLTNRSFESDSSQEEQ